jgi:hypothetical protein
MNPGDVRSRARIDRILKELKVGDLNQWQLAERIVLNKSTSIREYIRYLANEQKLIHVVDWVRPAGAGPYIPVLRYGPGENKPKPLAKTQSQIKADSYAKLRKDPERHEAYLRRQRALRRKPPKPDDMLAWVFRK